MRSIIVKTFAAVAAIATITGATAQAMPFPHSHAVLGARDGAMDGPAHGTSVVTPLASYDCGTIRQTMVDRYGNIVGYRYVPAC